MEKLKCYVLTVSKTFPVKHPRKRQLTCFASMILKNLKKHTIRVNYELWKKRIDEVNKGKAYISLRQWSGLPYKSKQVEFKQLHKGEVGIEKLQLTPLGWFINDKVTKFEMKDFASNDGLAFLDFVEWFKGANFFKEMAIIHFSTMRYDK